MTESQMLNQDQTQENKASDKELNFRALEAKYRKELEQERMAREQERQARLELENQVKRAQSTPNYDDDDESDEPYVDYKKLNKKLSNFEKKLEERFEKKVDERANRLLEQREQENWVKSNGDFHDVLSEENLMKFVNKAPAMAESIKRMPDGFEKQKLVYNAIKSMGIDQPEPKKSSVQDAIDANRRNPYYQPSGIGTSPYAAAGDFSSTGQKNAYAKMQELKNRLRMG